MGGTTLTSAVGTSINKKAGASRMVIDVKNGLACSAVVISTGPVRLKNRSKKGDSVVFDHQTYDGTSRVYS